MRKQGYTKDLVSMQGIGYKEIFDYLDGDFMKKFMALLLVAGMTLSLTACGGSTDTAKTDQADGKDTFTVGFDQDFPPFGYVGDDGEFTGFDIEMATECAARMGKKIVVSFLFAFFAFNMDAVDFSKERKKEEKTGDLASENSDAECEIGEVHSCFYLLKHFPKYSLFLLGLVFVFAAYNMNSTFLIDWIEGMGGNHADYGMAQFVLAMAEIPVALVFYRIRGRVSIDKLMVVCAFFCFLRATATTFSGSVTLVILSQALELLGLSIYYVGTVYFVMDYLPQADAVKGASLINLAGMGLGEMAGSISCGLIKDAFGLRNLMLLSSGVGLVGVVVMVWMWRRLE